MFCEQKGERNRQDGLCRMYIYKLWYIEINGWRGGVVYVRVWVCVISEYVV